MLKIREPPASREDGRSWNEGDGGEALNRSHRSTHRYSLASLLSYNIRRNPEPTRSSKINVVEELWESAESVGWRASSPPRSDWPPPTEETNGYLRVRCNGGLNQQRSAICNAVLAARIMNATLVLPELDANSFWHDDSGFQGIYDVEHFIQTLKYDVKIVGKIPDVHKKWENQEDKSFSDSST